jgi:transposase
MNSGRTVFSQIMALLPIKQFHRCVERYDGEHKVKSFSCMDQFLTLAFAQLTYRESLRDIEACLRALQPRLYHMGFRCAQISRNTLANANEQRDWRIYADFAQTLISEARALYAHEEFGLTLEETAFALDSTVIDLCLALFPWAPHQRSKAAVKVHTLLDLRGSIPTYLYISGAHTSDVSVLDHLPLQPGAIYVMDRGYIHFKRLYALAQAAVFFVVRARANMQFRRRYSHPVDTTTGLRSDQTILLTGVDSSYDYPAPARRIHFFDQEHSRHLTFLTNHFSLPALSVAQLYKGRWKVELFFKWIKQHLRIKAFYGHSANAVKTQIWIAVSVYLLIAILKKRLGLRADLYRILQVASLTLFEKTPFLQAFESIDSHLSLAHPLNQLRLFD